MLPVSQVYSELVHYLKDNPTAILQAPPGAGKSTWLPLQLIKDKHYNHIVLLEPRRVAARNIALYLAQCLGEQVGETVGLRMRGETKVSSQTKLEIVTEGLLTRKLQSDPELTGVDLIIFDEFHERSLPADMGLAFALESQAAFRDDLKILIMSATLEHSKLSDVLDCEVIKSDGRSYPIDENYITSAKNKNWLEQIVDVVLQALNDEYGSVLVFLPGQKEITYVHQQLESKNLASNIELHQLIGSQNKSEQQRAMAKPGDGIRKVVLATNVAETSLTIEGIRIVIDSGKQRQSRFNLKNGVSQLETTNISKSSAIQRAGRAGRIEPGCVYRLGTKEEFERRPHSELPSILTSDISTLLLETYAWGATVDELTLLDRPTPAQMSQATKLLKMLQAFDDNAKLTSLGSEMLRFGSDLRFAHTLLKAKELDKDYPGIYVLAIYFVALQEAANRSSADLALSLNQQLTTPHPSFKLQRDYWLKKLGVKPVTTLPIDYLAIVVALAYPDRIAKRRGQGLILANGAGAKLHSDFPLHDDFLCIANMGGVQGQQVYSGCTAELSLLKGALPHLFSEREVCEYQEKTGRFIAAKQECIGAVVVKESANPNGMDVAMRTQAWLSLIHKKGLALLNLASVEQLLVRMELAGTYLPNEFETINQSILLDNLTTWLAPFIEGINSLEQLKKLDLTEAVLAQMSWQQQQKLDELLPKRLKVPTGSFIKVQYQLNGPAKLAVKMQEVYGLTATPSLLNGNLALAMELLSPAMRPLQITQDLAHFWQNSYKDVQKEMKGRYPKHFWPDDPATSVATNRVKSRM